MKWLVWKDFKLSKWWILANVIILSTLGIIGVYLTYFMDFPGIILVLLSMAGVLFGAYFPELPITLTRIRGTQGNF